MKGIVLLIVLLIGLFGCGGINLGIEGNWTTDYVEDIIKTNFTSPEVEVECVYVEKFVYKSFGVSETYFIHALKIGNKSYLGITINGYEEANSAQDFGKGRLKKYLKSRGQVGSVTKISSKNIRYRDRYCLYRVGLNIPLDRLQLKK